MPVSLSKKNSAKISLSKKICFREKIKIFRNRYQILERIMIVIIVLLLWIFFPKLYLCLAQFILDKKIEGTVKLNEIGDVYGSLNTLFSSLTLLIVVYSMILQGKANKEISEAANRQILIAEKNHKEQLKASRHAIFTTMFHSLLTHKSERFNQISMSTKDRSLDACEISNLIADEFHKLVRNKWKNLNDIEKKDLENSFEYCVAKITKGKGYYKIYNYFFIYESIFNLIKNEKLNLVDEEYFKDLVRNSMEVGEQMTILWIASFSDYYQKFLMDSGIFSFELPDDHIPFINKFLSSTLFFNRDFVSKLDDYSKNQNPI